MKKTSINSSVPILLILLLVIEMEIMDNLFPFPGPKAFFAIPMIYLMCSIVIILGIFLPDKLNLKSRKLVWFMISVINSLIVFFLYPK